MKRFKDNLTKNSLIVFILTTIGSAINYLCQIFMGRYFSIENYGIINTVFSITLIISVVGSTASMILSKIIAENGNNTKDITYRIIKIVNISSVILVLIGIIFLPFLLKILGNSVITSILTVITLVTSIYPILYQGILGGLHKFTKLGLYTLIIPVLKTIGISIAIFLKLEGTLELYVAILFIVLGNVISIILGQVITIKSLKKADSKETNVSTKDIWENYKDIFEANILIMFLMNIDILYLSYFYDSETIGLYSSVLTFGKMIYYFVTALVTVMLPMISKNKKNNEYVKQIFYKTLLYTGILTVLLLIPANVFSKPILEMVFGNKYSDAISYMKYASFISLSYSLNLIVLNYLVGVGKTKFIKNTLVGGSILVIILLLIFNYERYVALLLIGFINSVTFIVNMLKIHNSESIGGK